MSGFKDMVARDVKNIFLNSEEFGETHTVNGHRMTIVLSGADHTENDQRDSEGRTRYGKSATYSRQIVMHVASEDFGRLPAQGDDVVLDRMHYQVADAVDQQGMFCITLDQAQSRQGVFR